MPNKTKLNRQDRRLRQRRQRRDAAGQSSKSPSPQRPHAPSSSPASRVDSIQALERFDGFAFLRNQLRKLARERDDWAGIPMPLAGERLVIEPRYPNAQALMDIGAPEHAETEEERGWREINRWHQGSKGREIVVYAHEDGRRTWGVIPAVHSLPMALSTLGCAEAWGIEQEGNAVKLLGELVTHRQFKQYMLTGMFLERSKRSQVHYLFRRLRPTVAIVTGAKDTTRILCALCMHPIAYYSGTWAGAMTPTDDVVAHLTMMRGDEPMFWKRSTQHPSWRKEAGL